MRSLFERMAEAQTIREADREAVRRAKVGDVLQLAPPKRDIRPAFTGAGAPSFKPARKGKK